MSGDRAVCYARNALCPSAVLSRLFNIPLARPRSTAFPTPHAATFSTARRRLQDAAPAKESETEDRHAHSIDPSSLSNTVEAHRRANAASIVRRVVPRSIDDSTVWHRPSLPETRFDPVDAQTQRRDGGKQTSDKRQSWLEWQITNMERDIPPADYAGQYVEPLYDADVPDSDLPWFAASQLPNASPMERLNAEMKAFHAYVQPTLVEQAARRGVIGKAINNFVKYRNGLERPVKAQLEIFGSSRTGLALATSDIDLRLFRPAPEDTSDDRKQAPRFVERRIMRGVLENAVPVFKRSKDFMLVVLRHSRYPLISMQDRSSGLDIQIVCSNDTSLSRSVQARYLEELPNLHTIYSIFRYALEIRGLSDVFRGGISSYTIFYMIVAGLKLGPPAPKDDAAAQLLSVLEFYSKLDTEKHWISVDPPETLEKIDTKPTLSKEEKAILKARHMIGLKNMEQPYLPSIVDPADATNDVGRKAFGWKNIQTTMMVLHEELRTRIENDDRRLLLTPLVGRGFDLFEARRQKVADFGNWCLKTQEDAERNRESEAEKEPEELKAGKGRRKLRKSSELKEMAQKSDDNAGTGL